MASKDPTAAERVKRQRANRLAQGWAEVRVWVPSEADAKEIRRQAATMRRRSTSRTPS